MGLVVDDEIVELQRLRRPAAERDRLLARDEIRHRARRRRRAGLQGDEPPADDARSSDRRLRVGARVADRPPSVPECARCFPSLSFFSFRSFFAMSCWSCFSARSVRFSRFFTFCFSCRSSALACFFEWRSRSRRVMYVMPQSGTSHLNGRSSVCSALMCTLSALRLERYFPHDSHWNGFTPRCVFSCDLRSPLL